MAAFLAGVGSLVAFVLLHAAMGWLHVLLVPAGVAVLVALWRGRRREAGASETEVARLRYDRLAPFYDLIELGPELRARGWRRRLWRLVEGERVLEIGVGTGKNLRFHPPGVRVVAVDLSPAMLARAGRRAERLGSSVELRLADAQALPFADASFDTVIATFVFCSVPDAAVGLREARRVLVPGGRLLLLEHVLSRRVGLRRLMRWLDPLVVRLCGAHLARETVETVRGAGFVSVDETNLSLDVVKQIVARSASRDGPPLAETTRCPAAPR